MATESGSSETKLNSKEEKEEEEEEEEIDSSDGEKDQDDDLQTASEKIESKTTGTSQRRRKTTEDSASSSGSSTSNADDRENTVAARKQNNDVVPVTRVLRKRNTPSPHVSSNTNNSKSKRNDTQQQKQQSQPSNTNNKNSKSATTSMNKNSTTTTAATTTTSREAKRDGWKYDRKEYPQKSSRIGSKYQITDLPPAEGHHQKDGDGDLYSDIIWDPIQANKAEASGGLQGESTEKEQNIDLIEQQLQQFQGKKEGALWLLAQNGYNLSQWKDKVDASVRADNGSDWTDETIALFRNEIFRCRKDWKILCQTMDIPLKTALAYYYGKYKSSNEYQLLKTVCSEERYEHLVGFVATGSGTTGSGGSKYKRKIPFVDSGAGELPQHPAVLDACAICGNGGSLLICDGCEGEYHLGCLQPPLQKVPEGHWECDECVDRKVLLAHSRLVQTTGLFQRATASPTSKTRNMEGAGKKRSLDQMAESVSERKVETEEETSSSLTVVARKEPRAGDTVTPIKAAFLPLEDVGAYRPTEPVLDAARKFADRIGKALTQQLHS